MSRIIGIGAVTAVLGVALALAGCATPAPSTVEPDGARGEFMVCLEAAGETVKVVEGGLVAVLLPEEPDSGDVSPPDEFGGGWVTLTTDAEGAWQASHSAEGFSENGTIRAAYALCEDQVPAFEQPDPEALMDEDSGAVAERVEASLAFAECARENGFADFADPTTNGSLNFPVTISEDQFRTVVEACVDAVGEVGLHLAGDIGEVDFDWMSVLDEMRLGIPISGPANVEEPE